MARQRRKVETPIEAAKASVWARLKERISLPELEAWTTTLRTVLLNGLFLIAVIVVVPVLFTQFKRDQVVIELIAVPETLSLQGMTPEVAANRIWDGLGDVAEAANTAKQSIAAIPDSRRVEFSFPDSGFSIESLIFHVRRLFNAYETRIAGEIVCADADCKREGLRLRLRVISDHVDMVDLGPIGARTDREYFAEAASGVLATLDPFVALAAASEKAPLKATILARRLIRSHHPDAKWAHNLIGLVRANAGESTAATDEFRAAIAIDPDFLPARSNLGNVLLRAGDVTAARAEFDEIRRRDAENVHAAEGYADIALAAGDHDGAVKHLLEAAELDPVSPRYFAKAGKIEMEAGRADEATRLLANALELDPGYLPAFAVLGAMHLAKDDYQSAEKIYRDAADYAPDDAEAQASHGRMLAILKDWNGCVQRYVEAVALEPDNAGYRLEHARCLQPLGRHDAALALLEEAAKRDPGKAEIYMSMGDSYRDTSRKQEAIAAYRKFLELDTGSIMRPVAERFIELLSAENAPQAKPIDNLYTR